jgi:hypothetical protein
MYSTAIGALIFQANFIGKEALTASRGDWRNQRLTMLEVDVANVDPEGNQSIWSCGRVSSSNICFCFEINFLHYETC